MELPAFLAIGPWQVGERDVLADGRTEGDGGRVGATAELIDQHFARFRIHHRQVADGIALHAVLVCVLRHHQRAEHGRLVRARLVFQMLRLAAEVGVLDLRAGEVGLDKIVLREEVGILQAQALFHRREFA